MKSYLTKEQKIELDKRLKEYLSGNGKNYSWRETLRKVKAIEKKIKN